MNSKCLFAFGVVFAMLAGCSTPEFLAQPADIPLFVTSYAVPELKGMNNANCSLNLVNCAPEAMLAKVSFSGSRIPESRFPVRDIVDAEFNAVIKANFALVSAGEQPKLEMKVESRRLILERDGDDLSFNLSLAVKLIHPTRDDKPFFSKVYSVRTFGVRENETNVPNCVYEAVQRIAMAFVRDVAKDKSLVARLGSI